MWFILQQAAHPEYSDFVTLTLRKIHLLPALEALFLLGRFLPFATDSRINKGSGAQEKLKNLTPTSESVQQLNQLNIHPLVWVNKQNWCQCLYYAERLFQYWCYNWNPELTLFYTGSQPGALLSMQRVLHTITTASTTKVKKVSSRKKKQRVWSWLLLKIHGSVPDNTVGALPIRDVLHTRCKRSTAWC